MVQPNLHCVMCDFFPCCRTHVISRLCHFKSQKSQGVKAGGCMMRTVISVPSTGAASIPLIPRVIPAAQQRSQTQRGRQTGRTEQHSRCSRHAHTWWSQPLFMKIGSDDWWLNWCLHILANSSNTRSSRSVFGKQNHASKKRWSHTEATIGGKWFCAHFHAYL